MDARPRSQAAQKSEESSLDGSAEPPPEERSAPLVSIGDVDGSKEPLVRNILAPEASSMTHEGFSPALEGLIVSVEGSIASLDGFPVSAKGPFVPADGFIAAPEGLPRGQPASTLARRTTTPAASLSRSGPAGTARWRQKLTDCNPNPARRRHSRRDTCRLGCRSHT